MDSTKRTLAGKLSEAGYISIENVKYFLAPKVTLGTGIRKNIAINNQKDFLNTQVNLNYKPTKAWTINLAAGRYNKFHLPQSETADPFRIEADQYSMDVSWNKSGFENSLSFFYKKSTYSETFGSWPLAVG